MDRKANSCFLSICIGKTRTMLFSEGLRSFSSGLTMNISHYFFIFFAITLENKSVWSQICCSSCLSCQCTVRCADGFIGSQCLIIPGISIKGKLGVSFFISLAFLNLSSFSSRSNVFPLGITNMAIILVLFSFSLRQLI